LDSRPSAHARVTSKGSASRGMITMRVTLLTATTRASAPVSVGRPTRSIGSRKPDVMDRRSRPAACVLIRSLPRASP
jgi:hypothetical protein